MKEWEKRKRENRVSRKKEVSVLTGNMLAGTQDMGRGKGRIPSSLLLQQIWLYLTDSADYEKINFEIPLTQEAKFQHLFYFKMDQNSVCSIGFPWTYSIASVLLLLLVIHSTLRCKLFSPNETFSSVPTPTAVYLSNWWHSLRVWLLGPTIKQSYAKELVDRHFLKGFGAWDTALVGLWGFWQAAEEEIGLGSRARGAPEILQVHA